MAKKHLLTSLFFFLMTCESLQAIEKVLINIDKIVGQSWQLKNSRISLDQLETSSPHLRLYIEKLSLRPPLSSLQLLDIHCLQFNWQVGTVTCRQGQASYQHPLLKPGQGQFDFSLGSKKSSFTLNKLDFAGGLLSITATEKGHQWRATITLQGLKLAKITDLLNSLKVPVDELTGGQITAKIQLAGKAEMLNRVLVDLTGSQLSLQAKAGQLAADKLDFQLNLKANKRHHTWYWQVNNALTQGELYVDPVYLPISNRKIQLTATGYHQLQSNTVILHHALLEHDKVARLTWSGNIPLPHFTDIDSGILQFDTDNLSDFFNIYLAPFGEQANLTELKPKGQLNTTIKFNKTQLQQATLQFNHFSLKDNQNRIEIDDGQGAIYWSLDSNMPEPSWVSWKQLKVADIPLQSSQLNFVTEANHIYLQDSVAIPLWGGRLVIDQFKWEHQADNIPQLFFQGGIDDISLLQLSTALNGPTLSGKISGYIPGVHYQNKVLTLDGELKVKLFDGEITIHQLTLANLLTDFPQLTMDMDINQLDLYTLTKKFEIGEIEGRISGFVNNLVLENWQPISFYAWLGTPENDDSNHRISQKAVENIASIGGGGAADVISKGFLRFFDRFGYDKLGFGCYLHHGVCQLMGVEAVDQGYYIIKGGGLPRIDVIGYNPQLDWDILIQRLARITATNQVIVE